MKKLKPVYIITILLWSHFFGAQAQTPNAEFVTGDIDVCETGQVTVELKIRFYGDDPFGYTLQDPRGNITINNGKDIFDEDLDDGVYTLNYNFEFDVNDGDPNRTGTFEILEVFDSSITGEWNMGEGQPLSGVEISFTNWAMPNPSAGADIDSCGLQAVLSAVPDPISNNYSWQTPAEGTIQDTSDPNTTFEGPEKGNYLLVFRQENGACSNTDDVNVLLRGSPSASLSTSSEVCGTEEQAATLELVFEGEDGPWEYAISDGDSETLNGTSANATTSETVNVNGETTFSFLWVRDNNGCLALQEDISDEATVIDLLPSPDAGNDTAVCGVKNIVLTHQPSAKAQYGYWGSQTGTFSGSTNPNDSVFEAPDWGEHIVTWTETNKDCSASDSRIVRFDEPPLAEITNGETDTLYHTNSTILHARTPLSDPLSGDWKGEWYFVSGSGNIASPSDTITPISNINNGPVTIEWLVTNGVCPAEFDQIVLYLQNLTYYTGISPDGNGKNDCFKIKGSGEIDNKELIVFDQNGAVVYYNKDYENEEEVQWNGTDKNGKPLDSGVYYFVFKGEGIESVKDYLIIKRN
jgi:gliding motility-associated-like protein